MGFAMSYVIAVIVDAHSGIFGAKILTRCQYRFTLAVMHAAC